MISILGMFILYAYIITSGCDKFQISSFLKPCKSQSESIQSRSNQSILKENSPGCSLEGLILKLKLQSFGHLMRRADSFEKTLMLGKIEGRKRRGRQRMRWLDGITDSMHMGLSDSGSWCWTGRPGVLRFMGLQRVRHD